MVRSTACPSASTLANAPTAVAATAGTFSLSGTSFSVDPTTQSLDDVVTAINAQTGTPGLTVAPLAIACGSPPPEPTPRRTYFEVPTATATVGVAKAATTVAEATALTAVARATGTPATPLPNSPKAVSTRRAGTTSRPS